MTITPVYTKKLTDPVAALVLAVAALPVVAPEIAIGLGLASGALSITAEALDDKPCRGQRIAVASGFAGVGAAAGAVFGGVSQAAADSGDDGMKAAGDCGGRGFGAGGLAGNLVNATC